MGWVSAKTASSLHAPTLLCGALLPPGMQQLSSGPGPALTGTSSRSFPLFLTVWFAPTQAEGCFSLSSFRYVEAIFRMFAALWCPAALQGCPLFPGPVRLLADIFPVSALQPPDVCSFSLEPGYLCNSSHQQGTLSLLDYRAVSLEIHVWPCLVQPCHVQKESTMQAREKSQRCAGVDPLSFLVSEEWNQPQLQENVTSLAQVKEWHCQG